MYFAYPGNIGSLGIHPDGSLEIPSNMKLQKKQKFPIRPKKHYFLIQGPALIRTGQKYEWSVPFFFLILSPVLFFLKNLSPVQFCPKNLVYIDTIFLQKRLFQ